MVELQLYSEGKLYSSTSLFPTIAFLIETTSLVDGTYKLIQEPDEDISEAQANFVELTEVSNSDSEEPKPTDSIDATEGKPLCIILLPLQFLEIGSHVEIHAIEWHDFQHETQFHGSCSGMNRIFSKT